MNEEDRLIKEAQLGMETEAFLRSDLGKMLLNRAAQELEQGYQGLLTVLPSDTDTLLKLQSQCLRAIHFQQWLNEAITSGEYAERELSDE